MRTGRFLARLRIEGGRSVTFRSLCKRDAAACTTFINKLVRERRTDPTLGITMDRIMTRKEEEKEYLSKLLAGIRRNNAVSVAAFVRGRMVGNCEVFRRRPTDMRHTGLLGIAILKEYRDAGIGQRMLGLLLRDAKNIGVTLVELDVFAPNARAIHVYKKLGFKTAGRIPGKVLRDGELTDTIFMYAELKKN